MTLSSEIKPFDRVEVINMKHPLRLRTGLFYADRGIEAEVIINRISSFHAERLNQPADPGRVCISWRDLAKADF